MTLVLQPISIKDLPDLEEINDDVVLPVSVGAGPDDTKKLTVGGLKQALVAEVLPTILSIPKGDPGPPGSPGNPGTRGERGERGDRGDRGDRGLKGDLGPPGERGYRGDRGERGERGYQGERGLQGLKGEKGDPGGIIPDTEKIIPFENASSYTLDNWQEYYATLFGNRVLVQINYEDVDSWSGAPGTQPDMVSLPGVQVRYRRDEIGNTTSVHIDWGTEFIKGEIILGT